MPQRQHWVSGGLDSSANATGTNVFDRDAGRRRGHAYPVGRCSGQRLKAIAKSIAANHAVAPACATHAMMGATSNIDAVAMQTVCGELEAEAKAASVQAK